MEELATGFGLVEGPTWINDTGLLFSDVIKGGVYLLDHLNNVSPIVEHRRGIGGIAIHQENGLIVGGKNIASKVLQAIRQPYFYPMTSQKSR